MKKHDKPKSKNEIDTIAEKMKMSLESTNSGLALFSESLQKSGLVSSLSAYQQMMSVLVQQKKWTDTNSRTEMQDMWNQIAKNSENIFQIMNAYSGIMNKLRILNTDNLPKQEAKEDTKKDKILIYLKKYSEFPISELSDNLKMKKKEIKEELEPLVKKGILEKKGKGKTLSYRLKDK